MREKLEKLNGQRINVTARFERFGKIVKHLRYYDVSSKTVLLKNVKDENNNIIAEHLWFKLIKGFEKLDLKQDDIISFSARVTEYEKGYKYRRWVKDETTPEEEEEYEYACNMVSYNEIDVEPDEDDYFAYQEYYDYIRDYQSIRTL